MLGDEELYAGWRGVVCEVTRSCMLGGEELYAG